MVKRPTPNIELLWTKPEKAIFKTLTSPEKIQAFLDSIPYSADSFYRSPRSVIRDQKAHCFDGALFAACALRQLGYPPRLIDLRAVRDDDHIIALFARNNHLGAIAKSNFVGLRYREPIFRSMRELVLSYFEDYYNTEGEKTLRGYSTPLNLKSFDRLKWTIEDENLHVIAAELDNIRHFDLLTTAMEKSLSLVDNRSYQSGMVGVNEAGLYRPKGKKKSKGSLEKI